MSNTDRHTQRACALGSILAVLSTVLLLSMINAPSALATEIEDVTCISSTDCVAVGKMDTTDGPVGQVRRWNGAEWSSESAPLPSGAAGSKLSGVSCLSASDCSAVGSYTDAEGAANFFALHWNGTAWLEETTPIPSGATSSELNGISCKGVSCLAVGSYVSSAGVETEAAISWNGTEWSSALPSEPLGSTASSLSGVACYSSVCAAVGKYTNSSGVVKPLLQTRGFGVWNMGEAPAPSDADATELTDISCNETLDTCAVVGSYTDTSGVLKALILRYEEGWTVSPHPGIDGEHTRLDGVACISAAKCAAVGSTEDSDGQADVLALSWDGSAWTEASPELPLHGLQGALMSAVCLSESECIAAGHVTYSRLGEPRNLAYGGSGTEWSVTDDGPRPTRNWTRVPPSSAGGELTDVACDDDASTDWACFEVGWTRDAGDDRHALVRSRSNVGSSFGISYDVTAPGGATSSELRGLTCHSPEACIGVGNYTDEEGRARPLTVHWDGSAWNTATPPSPADSTGAGIEDVHCASASSCHAAGSFITVAGVEKAVFYKWDTSSWSVAATYEPSPDALATRFTGVWCAGVVCVGIGAYTNSAGVTKPLAVRTAFGSVVNEGAPAPFGSNAAELQGLSCLSVENCVAVGKYVDGEGSTRTLAQHWNGTEWAIKSTPNPGFEGNENLSGVYCEESSSCVAVGGYQYEGNIEPLDIEWDGTSWSETTAPGGWNNPEFGGASDSVGSSFADISCTGYREVGNPEMDADCHAVGGLALKDHSTRPLWADWDGISWRSRNVGQAVDAFVDVHCDAPGSCMAIGEVDNHDGSRNWEAAARAWTLDEDGQWGLLPAAPAEGMRYIALDCLDLAGCMVIGEKDDAGNRRSMALWWDGESWAGLTGLDKDWWFNEVDCSSSTSCVAVGNDFSSEERRQLAVHWNGTEWTAPTVPTPGLRGQLTSVSCVSASDCTASGFYNEEDGLEAPSFPQLIRWDGTSWSSPSLPSLPGSGHEFDAVTCFGASSCVVAGTERVNGAERLLSLLWDGTSWTHQAGPGPKAGADFALRDVTCVTSEECLAVGLVSPETAISYAWDGFTWSIDEVPTPKSVWGSRLEGVTCSEAPNEEEEEAEPRFECLSAGSLVAKGIQENNDQRRLVEPFTVAQDVVSYSEAVEDGKRTWSPSEVWDPSSGFDDVWCTSTSNCVAVGSYINTEGAPEAQIKRGTGSTWSEAVAPVPAGSKASALSGVSCTSASSCTAVGHYQDPSEAWKTLAMRWNGASWSISSTPTPSGAQYVELSGVACNSESACQAVGRFLNSGGEEEALALRWNGSSWSQSSVPMPSEGLGSQLADVACTSSTSCRAVGSFYRESGGAKTFVGNWNGSSWSAATTPNVHEAAGNNLADIACTSASSCMAVGSFETVEGVARTMAMRWNGSSWWIISVPNEGLDKNYLSSVSCPASDACFAIGAHKDGVEELPMAIGWNGSAWSIDAVEALSKDTAADVFTAGLAGVSCASTADCIATGTYATQNGLSGSADSEEVNGRELTYQYNGSEWQRPVETPPSASISGIACPDSNTCIAIGAGDEPDDEGGTINQAWKLYKGKWQPIPMPSPSATKSLADIACSANDACTAVGAETSSGEFLVERWNGSGWTSQSAPTPASGGAHRLRGASCPDASACVAVGSSQVGGEATAMRAIHWDGTSWSESTVTAPGGATSSVLYDVDCTAAADCVAVGNYVDSGGVEKPLVRHWNGTSWSAGTVSAPGEAVATVLKSVSCSSQTACTAVGSYRTSGEESSRRSFIVRRSESTWTTQTAPQFEDVTRTELFDVVCTADSECVALGTMVVLAGENVVENAKYSMVLAWDGTEWKVEAGNRPNGAPDPAITALACASGESCVAAGETHTAAQPAAMVTQQPMPTSSAAAGVGATERLTATASVVGQVARKPPCKRGIKNRFYINQPGALAVLVGGGVVARGKVKAEVCWKGNKVARGRFYGEDAFVTPRWDNLWNAVNGGTWKQRECLPNRRKCIGKYFSYFKCCSIVIKGIGPGVWKRPRCIETELWSPRLRAPGHKRHIKNGRCMHRNYIEG